jgi:hypothetical protein
MVKRLSRKFKKNDSGLPKRNKYTKRKKRTRKTRKLGRKRRKLTKRSKAGMQADTERDAIMVSPPVISDAEPEPKPEPEPKHECAICLMPFLDSDVVIALPATNYRHDMDREGNERRPIEEYHVFHRRCVMRQIEYDRGRGNDDGVYKCPLCREDYENIDQYERAFGTLSGDYSCCDKSRFQLKKIGRGCREVMGRGCRQGGICTRGGLQQYRPEEGESCCFDCLCSLQRRCDQMCEPCHRCCDQMCESCVPRLGLPALVVGDDGGVMI